MVSKLVVVNSIRVQSFFYVEPVFDRTAIKSKNLDGFHCQFSIIIGQKELCIPISILF